MLPTMRRLVGVLAGVMLLAAGSLVTVGGTRAAAGSGQGLKIDAVVTGTPNASGLQVERVCVDGASDATSSVFTASQSDVIPVVSWSGTAGPTVTCRVSVIEDGGLVPSFKCEDQANLPNLPPCADNQTVESNPTFGGVYTITVTFGPAPTTTTTPAAVVAPPSFTG